MILVLVIVLSNSAFAQTESLHDRRLSELVKQTSVSSGNAQIKVGRLPFDIAIGKAGTLYVADSGSNTVFVISTENNAKIKDIPVGIGPVALAINEDTNTIYVANNGSNTVSVIDGWNNTMIQEIPVGVGPTDLAINEDAKTLGVLNSSSVSIISTENNTKIKDIPVDGGTAIVFKQYFNPFAGPPVNKLYIAGYGWGWSWVFYLIPIGIDTNIANIGHTSVVDPVANVENRFVVDPVAIAINESSHSDTVYVANSGPNISANSSNAAAPNTISVIDGGNNTIIPVGVDPTDLAINEDTNTIYVANSGSNTVSVISTENNTKIKDIPVGATPVAIGVDTLSDTVYVLNKMSKGISLIDGEANELVTGVTFHVKPFNAGYILCDGLSSPSPTEQYVYVLSGTQCVAKPNEGFEFASWEENLEGNSTQLISISRPASASDYFFEFLHLKSADKPEAKLMTKFGTFTANFKEIPPAVPSEYLIPLYGIIISTIVGWSIPSIIGWASSKSYARKLSFYHKQIASLYGDGKLDEDDIEALDKLRSNIVDAYSRGKLNEKHYESLRNEISILYEKIFRKRIDDSLDNNNKNNNSSNNKTTQEQLAQIKNEVKYAYSEGKLNEKHYDLLNKDILDLEGK